MIKFISITIVILIIVIEFIRLLMRSVHGGSVIDNNYENDDQEFSDEMNNQQHQEFLDEMNREEQQRFMDESMKSVTPFEHGGYDMDNGNSFNDMNMF